MAGTWKTWAMLGFAVAFTLLGYLLVNSLVASRDVFFSVELPWDASIPFVSYFIVFYAFVYIEPVVVFIIFRKNFPLVKAAFKAFMANAIITQMSHLVFPVRFDLRPELHPPYSIFEQVVRFYYWIDAPYNCFPSLHVASTFLCARTIYLYKKSLYPIFLFLAWMITLSTLFIKQHYVMDLFGGFLLYFVLRGIFLPKDLLTREDQSLSLAESAEVSS